MNNVNADNQAVDLYTKTDLSTTFKRTEQYIKENPDKQTLAYRIASVSIGTIAMTTVAGTCVGGAAGGIIGLVAGAAVPSALTGAKIGCGVGFSVGLILSPITTIVSIKTSQEYINWKTQALVNRIYPIYQEYLKQDEEFRDLICPISHELPVVPVRSPNGHVYEKSEIETWLDSNPNNPCPMRGNPFTKADLIYDEKHVRKIVMRARALMNQHVIQNQDVEAGIKALSNNLVERSASLLAEELSQVAKEALEKDFSPELFSTVAKTIYQKHLIPAA